jgi:hypothetical protein
MLIRRLARVAGVLGAVLVLVAGTAVPAHASPSRFQVSYVHAGGTGAVAVSVKGGFTWLNRSVVLTDVRLFVKANECGVSDFLGLHGEVEVDYTRMPYDHLCVQQDTWVGFGDILLNGSQQRGGIIEVRIGVSDSPHGSTEAVYLR